MAMHFSPLPPCSMQLITWLDYSQKLSHCYDLQSPENGCYEYLKALCLQLYALLTLINWYDYGDKQDLVIFLFTPFTWMTNKWNDCGILSHDSALWGRGQPGLLRLILVRAIPLVLDHLLNLMTNSAQCLQPCLWIGWAACRTSRLKETCPTPGLTQLLYLLTTSLSYSCK